MPDQNQTPDARERELCEKVHAAMDDQPADVVIALVRDHDAPPCKGCGGKGFYDTQEIANRAVSSSDGGEREARSLWIELDELLRAERDDALRDLIADVLRTAWSVDPGIQDVGMVVSFLRAFTARFPASSSPPAGGEGDDERRSDPRKIASDAIDAFVETIRAHRPGPAFEGEVTIDNLTRPSSGVASLLKRRAITSLPAAAPPVSSVGEERAWTGRSGASSRQRLPGPDGEWVIAVAPHSGAPTFTFDLEAPKVTAIAEGGPWLVTQNMTRDQLAEHVSNCEAALAREGRDAPAREVLKRAAAEMWDAMQQPPGPPEEFRGAPTHWKAGYLDGLGKAREIVAVVAPVSKREEATMRIVNAKGWFMDRVEPDDEALGRRMLDNYAPGARLQRYDGTRWVDVPACEDGGDDRDLDKLLEIADEAASLDPRMRGVTDKEVILGIVEEIAADRGISTARLDDADRDRIVQVYRDGGDDGDR